jgi:urease accessory protein
MLIKEKLGNLLTINREGRLIDLLPLEWHETNKRILHKQTVSGKELTLKFLAESPNLQQDDVLYDDGKCMIVVNIVPCDVILLKPSTMQEMAYACYEIGNKHLPLYLEEDCLLMPYEAPLFRLLEASGFAPLVEKRKLLRQLRTTVLPHAHLSNKSESLFSKILKLTTTADNE